MREWCFDRDKRFSLRVLSDLQGEERGEIRAVRGESWSSLVYACRTTNRNWYSPQEIRSNIGFSVALTPRSK
ncbi:MAG: SUMF1/EgtB/PvdO family nonheme iron enzyme [Opitutales bacterium]